MTSSVSKQCLVAAACALAFCLPAASATTIALTPTGSGAYSGSFAQPVTGFAFDNFDFTPGSLSGLVTVSLSSADPTKLFTATLNGTDFSYDPLQSSVFSFQSLVTNAPLTLSVFAAAVDDMGNLLSGSYRGTVTVAAAVPEPQTWGMLFAGLGVVAFVVGRRRQHVPATLLRS